MHSSSCHIEIFIKKCPVLFLTMRRNLEDGPGLLSDRSYGCSQKILATFIFTKKAYTHKLLQNTVSSAASKQAFGQIGQWMVHNFPRVLSCLFCLHSARLYKLQLSTGLVLLGGCPDIARSRRLCASLLRCFSFCWFTT